MGWQMSGTHEKSNQKSKNMVIPLKVNKIPNIIDCMHLNTFCNRVAALCIPSRHRNSVSFFISS